MKLFDIFLLSFQNMWGLTFNFFDFGRTKLNFVVSLAKRLHGRSNGSIFILVDSTIIWVRAIFILSLSGLLDFVQQALVTFEMLD